MRNKLVEILVQKAKENNNVVLLTGDLGSGCLEPFQEMFPDRFFNVGIAEQNMMSVASGLAIEGKKVFIYSIGNFDTLRCLEQIRNDICYMNLDVNIISVGAGFEYGQLGFSHHATEDIACLRAMPNMSVFDTATVSEIEKALKVMFETKTPCYLRLNKKGIETKTKCPANMQPYAVKEGKDYAIFATGTILKEALKAAEMLNSNKINVAVYSCPCIKPMDKKALIKKMLDYKLIFTLEEHTVIGGLGGAFAEVLAGVSGNKPTLQIFGINDYYESTVGNRDYLREKYQINATHIAETMKKAIKQNKK